MPEDRIETEHLKAASALELANRWHIPPQLLNSLPYLLTMIVLVGVIGKATPPASLGKQH